MSVQRIDFKHVREHGDFAKVLGHYGIALEKDGRRDGQFKCLCPFHDDAKPSCKINSERNIFHCFVCDAGGNILDFVMEMETVPIREAASLIADWSGIVAAPGKAERVGRKDNGKVADGGKNRQTGRNSEDARKVERDRTGDDMPVKAEAAESTGKVAEADGVAWNRPLTFGLKNLVTDHPFMAERGLTPQMIETFALGVATRGLMKDRLVFPIHNKDGELVAYCGRYLGNEIPDDVPKYKQPPNFRKELELFNWQRVRQAGSDAPLVIVESFFSVVKLHALGKRCVSPMGRSLSDAQIALLKDGGIEKILLLFDGDDPGRKAVMLEGRKLLAEGFDVSAPVVSETFKPHRLSEAELLHLLE